ncbi:TPA: hypothetical protein O4E86_003465 [Klebsiella oxytoca]|uniref:hypothetical protein n=1 Tax=Klebsiella oxytoca TaxID=571 RepID=UPI001B9E8FA2|nr:hypothetical protein [Klebsiella oxytoca]MCW9662112.1 hypothetical protein [Klebsiella oxytoca]HBC7877538.1 hypothetical protein [Klebsiella oxytoca]HCL7584978.1 hypothetical protein [Klebsiella oxytoca]HCQ8452692.1 hypothetical protein [Klebsiella oxytoca]HCZ8656920.1 hypothetical protein [Klebsiella oxytoca]
MQENDIKDQQESEIQAFDFSKEFDALINAKGKITTSMLTAVNRYFLYFSFFESLLLGCSGGQKKSSDYAKALMERGVYDESIIRSTFSVFADRYLTDRRRYESLCGEDRHTRPDTKEKYYGVMCAKADDLVTQFELCLFVCFRLRNNLFHGPKWRYFLDGQEELLLTAGTFIHSILDKAPRSEEGWEFQDILSPTE